MKVLELMQNRYSVRKFDAKKVERWKIKFILDAAACAPTAVNYQPQRILVIDDKDGLEKMKDITPYHFNAPLVFVMCYDAMKSWKRGRDDMDFGIVDATVAMTQMLLEIVDLGLGGTFVGVFDAHKLSDAFSIPDNLVPFALLPAGYPAKDSKPSPLHYKKQSVENMAYYNSFSKKFE